MLPSSPSDPSAKGSLLNSEEQRLVDYAERIRQSEDPRVVIQIHLSRLQNQNRRDHHIRVARSVAEDMAKQFEGELFQLVNQDMVLTARDVSPEVVDDMVLRLRYLFSEDPVTRFNDDQTGGGFCTWYILPRDRRRFVDSVYRNFEVAEAHRRDREKRRQAFQGADAIDDRAPLTPATLARVADALRIADVSPLMRNQMICAVTRRDPPQPVMEELFVSIAELERAVVPDISLQANPWLFQYLTTVLDQRVLAEVSKNMHSERAYCLNLNISTVLSKEFQRFDAALALGARGRIVVELQKVDVFHDMGAFAFARDFLHERGYKICLDGLTHLTLPMIDRARLGFDFTKMYWSADLVSGVRSDMVSDLRQRVEQTGQSRMIVCRCDTEDAMRLGWDLGVSLFQGRFIDQVLAEAKRIGPAARSPIVKSGAIGSGR
ncbi:MAG: hypothetical protein H6843_11150 [Rhodospirillaceae bacterium]|nr:hypothetical protein [Rhodospirillaceae bacterium]